MKSFIDTLLSLIDSLVISCDAASLARAGRYEEAKVLMLGK
jgi:hypothetical protein